MATKHQSRVKVLIIGGGFGGVKALRQLYQNPRLDITLITDQETFRYGATIWRATTGYLKNTSYIPIASLVPVAPNVTLLFDTVEKIDREQRTIQTKSGTAHHYDYCIIGLGVVTSYFGIKGLEEFSYSIKSSEGFDKFRDHLHRELLEENALDKNYVVVGAGPTGVELAAALRSYMKQVARKHRLKRTKVNMELVEAAPQVLPMLSEKASRVTHKRLRKLGVQVMTKTVVKGETKNTVRVGTESIPTHTVIWTAGVTNNPFFANNPKQFTLNEKKRVVVDEYLRVDNHTFVIGDSAATKYSGLALTALHNASYVAKYIHASLDHKTIAPYKPLKPLTIIPVGEGWSVLEWRKLTISGRFASLLRTMYDFVGYSEVLGWRQAFAIWLRRNQRHEDCLHCRTLRSAKPAKIA
jgi:NADH dehydrogenase